jgi:hypothetical protein
VGRHKRRRCGRLLLHACRLWLSRVRSVAGVARLARAAEARLL